MALGISAMDRQVKKNRAHSELIVGRWIYTLRDSSKRRFVFALFFFSARNRAFRNGHSCQTGGQALQIDNRAATWGVAWKWKKSPNLLAPSAKGNA